MDAMQEWLDRRLNVMRIRRAAIEPPFGALKAHPVLNRWGLFRRRELGHGLDLAVDEGLRRHQ
jgi:hypothetical protein